MHRRTGGQFSRMDVQLLMIGVVMRENEMAFSTAFIKSPDDWSTVTGAIMALTRNIASDVRCIGSVGEISDDETAAEIVITQLNGAFDFALEIYFKGMCELAADSVGMYLAMALKSDVIVPDNDPSSNAWLRLTSNGEIESVQLDAQQVAASSTVAYNIT